MNRSTQVFCFLCVAGLSYWFASFLAPPRLMGNFESNIDKRLAKPFSERERESATVKVNQVWDRIEQKLAEVEPGVLAGLCEPATDREIKVLQERLGIELPPDFEASLRRHNGTTEPFGVFWLYSTTQIVEACATETQQSIDDWPAAYWEHLFRHEEGRWEPGALVAGSNYFALLIDTEQGGITLIQNDHSYSSSHHDSFVNLLDYLADALESGDFEIAETSVKRFQVAGWGCDDY